MPEFSTLPAYYSTISASPFDPLTAPHPDTRYVVSTAIHIPSTVKEEPTYLDLLPIPSSPPQPSLCSVSSDDSFVYSKTASTLQHLSVSSCVKKEIKLPTSPISVISKQRAATRSTTCRKNHVSPPCTPDTILSKHDLADLKGTTAARSRKMTEEERRVMLHKRRLRNRASAARSREKRSRTLLDLTTEVEELIKRTSALTQQAKDAAGEVRKLMAQNVLLVKENQLLKSELKM